MYKYIIFNIIKIFNYDILIKKEDEKRVRKRGGLHSDRRRLGVLMSLELELRERNS